MHEMSIGLLLPLIGTTLGAGMVFFLKKDMNLQVQRVFTGFAAGVMTAASVWSLLIPAMEQSAPMGIWAFLPAVIGFWVGILFLLGIDSLVPHLHLHSEDPEGVKSKLPKSTMLVLAVVIHNLPEGMAVGAIYAAWLAGESTISLAGALALSVGIAIQNFPEGAIISLPLRGEGVSRGKSFLWGVFSGAVEPLGALLTIGLAAVVIPVLPYLLSFAAGAMIYVVVEELIPESQSGEHSNIGTIGVAFGFVIMMILDVALG